MRQACQPGGNVADSGQQGRIEKTGRSEPPGGLRIEPWHQELDCSEAPAIVPRWVAAAFAVPLSAQLLCGPVIVLLQPQFSTYSLLANVLASPLVAPVTVVGTAAVPLTVLAPWAATALIAVAGTFCGAVAGTARLCPGLRWP